MVGLSLLSQEGSNLSEEVVKKGAWRSSSVLWNDHRNTSNGQVKGIAHQVFDFAIRVPPSRIDTHADNQAHANAILSYGFIECGVIYVADPQLAYDYYR